MVKDFPKNSDSSIFKARLREQELTSQEKLQEIQGAADELARQAIIDKLKQAEVEYEKLKLKLEQEASGRINNILSHVELSAAENEDNFTSGIDGLLAKLFKFFNFMDSELGVETDPQVYSMIRKREEAEKEAWIVGVIKFLRDKFNKLVKAIFSRDLSFQQKIDKEIKELYEKLFSGNLSPEEEAAILERLEALRDLKLKLQIFVVGAVIKMFAELFSVELTASVETTKEEGKEKAPAKEATKEVHENLEIKVDAKEKPTVPVSLFDFSSGVARPITLPKPELDLLPKSLKDILPPVPKDDMNKGNSGGLKQEVKERQGNENKKARKSEEPKQEVHPLKPTEQPVAKEPRASLNQGVRRQYSFGKKDIIDNQNDNFNKEKESIRPGNIEDFYNQVSAKQTSSKEDNNLNKEKTPIKPKLKIDDFYRSFPKVTEWKNDQVQEKVSSGFTGVKVDKCVEDQSVGKARGDR